MSRAPKHRFAGLANSGCWERMAVALKRELHAERRHLDNPTGVLVRRERLCVTLAGGLHV